MSRQEENSICILKLLIPCEVDTHYLNPLLLPSILNPLSLINYHVRCQALHLCRAKTVHRFQKWLYVHTDWCMHAHMYTFQSCKNTRVKRWLRLHFPMQKVQVQSLVGELRSHMPQCQKTKTLKKKKKKNRNNIVIHSIKTLKMIHIKKIFFRKATLLTPFSCHFLP